jgi:hypothetical protein
MRRAAVLAVAVAGAGLWLLLAATSDDPSSALWQIEPLLFVLLIAAVWRGPFVALSPRAMAIAIIGASWALGMAYEATLTVDGTGIGGVHPQTQPSFVLAQGDYIPIALALAALTRAINLDLVAAFWLGTGMSLTEGLIFTGVLRDQLAQADPLALLVAVLIAAYYALAYAYFVALPLGLVAPAPLWRSPGRPPRWWVALMTGFAVAFVIRLFWGLVWSPFATWAFDLPANLI